MITWLLFTLFAPVGAGNIWACVCVGVTLDMIFFGQIVQKIEKAIDKHRKNH